MMAGTVYGVCRSGVWQMKFYLRSRHFRASYFLFNPAVRRSTRAFYSSITASEMRRGGQQYHKRKSRAG
ncbi:protein of unknown function [Pararobbsia alpina]